MNNRLHTLIDQLSRGKVFTLPYILGDFKAHKHFLSQHARNAVCFVCPESVSSAITPVQELVRLPYPTCWVEDANGLGVLMHEAGDGIDAIFLVLTRGRWGIMFTGKVTADGSLLRAEDHPTAGPDAISIGKGVAAFLTAINCINVRRTESTPTSSSQSVRKAMGKHPLFSSWALEIDLDRSRKEGIDQGGTHASPRLHLRRGHARQHRTGVWCWVNPHVVGNKALGMVDKEYEAA